MIRVSQIQSPKLVFSGGKTETIPIKGLYKYGPYSMNTIRKIQIDVISIKEKHRTYNIDKFLDELNTKLKELFRVDARYHVLARVNYENTKRYEKYLEQVSTKIHELRKYDDKKSHVILQILPFRDTWSDSIYNHLRLLCLTKRQDFARALPVQSITLDRIHQYFNPHFGYSSRKYASSRVSKRNTAIVENLALGIYVKSGGIPWQIRGRISSLFNYSLYVGYDISRKDDKESVGSIIVYDNSGQLVYYKDFTVYPEHGKDIIPMREFYKFLVYLIDDARDDNHTIKTLIIHRDGGNFPQDELKALKNIYDRLKISYVAIAYSKMNNFPLLKSYKEKLTLADSGSYFLVGSQFVGDNKVHTILMQTLGNDLPIVRTMTPNLLKIMFFGASKDILGRHSYLDLIHEFARETFYLSRLNWSTKFGFSKLPVTIHYAHKASQLLSVGLQIGNLDKRKLWML